MRHRCLTSPGASAANAPWTADRPRTPHGLAPSEERTPEAMIPGSPRGAERPADVRPSAGYTRPPRLGLSTGSVVEPKTLITCHPCFRSARAPGRASLGMFHFQWLRALENGGPCLARTGSATSQRSLNSALADANGGTRCVGHPGAGAASRRDWPGEWPRSRGARAIRNAC